MKNLLFWLGTLLVTIITGLNFHTQNLIQAQGTVLPTESLILFTHTPTLNQLQSPTNSLTPTLTATNSPTPTPSFTPTPTYTPTPTLIPMVSFFITTNSQLQPLGEKYKMQIDIYSLLIGIIIGAAIAFLTKLSALRSLSLKLDKLGIALGVEGFAPEKPSPTVNVSDIKGTVGDIAGGNLDKSTYIAPSTIQQFYSAINQRLQDDIARIEKGMQSTSEKQGDLIQSLNNLDESIFGKRQQDIRIGVNKQIDPLAISLTNIAQNMDGLKLLLQQIDNSIVGERQDRYTKSGKDEEFPLRGLISKMQKNLEAFQGTFNNFSSNSKTINETNYKELQDTIKKISESIEQTNKHNYQFRIYKYETQDDIDKIYKELQEVISENWKVATITALPTVKEPDKPKLAILLEQDCLQESQPQVVILDKTINEKISEPPISLNAD